MSLMADEELSSKESAESPVQLPSALVLAVEKPSLADCAVSETDFHPLDPGVGVKLPIPETHLTLNSSAASSSAVDSSRTESCMPSDACSSRPESTSKALSAADTQSSCV